MYQYVDARSPPIRCYLLDLDRDLDLHLDLDRDLDRDLDLDFDAHCKRDTPTGPNLGYSVSGQGGSTLCFRGSERSILGLKVFYCLATNYLLF